MLSIPLSTSSKWLATLFNLRDDHFHAFGFRNMGGPKQWYAGPRGMAFFLCMFVVCACLALWEMYTLLEVAWQPRRPWVFEIHAVGLVGTLVIGAISFLMVGVAGLLDVLC